MKNKIILYLAFMILIINVVYAAKFFVLDINYILGSVTFNSRSLREIDREIKYTDKSGFLLKTVSSDNSDLVKIYYNMSENKNYVIYIPYDKNAVKILVNNANNAQVMDIDVSSFADTCGNGICEPYESYESCTKDCKSGSNDDFCDGVKDGICDPDCSPKTDVDCNDNKNEAGSNISSPSSRLNKQNETPINLQTAEQTKSNYFLWSLIAIGIIVIVSIFFLIRKFKENHIVNSLKQYIAENVRKGFTLQQIKDVLYREGYKEKEVDKAIKSI